MPTYQENSTAEITIRMNQKELTVKFEDKWGRVWYEVQAVNLLHFYVMRIGACELRGGRVVPLSVFRKVE